MFLCCPRNENSHGIQLWYSTFYIILVKRIKRCHLNDFVYEWKEFKVRSRTIPRHLTVGARDSNKKELIYFGKKKLFCCCCCCSCRPGITWWRWCVPSGTGSHWLMLSALHTVCHAALYVDLISSRSDQNQNRLLQTLRPTRQSYNTC